MDFSAAQPNPMKQTPVPQYALVFHGLYNDAITSTTRHPITDGQIGAGEYIELAVLKEQIDKAVIAQSGPSRDSNEISFAPETLLLDSPQKLIWWVPENRRTFHFRGNKKGFHGAMTHPPMLFIADKLNQGLRIFALGENVRPTPDSMLYHAPFFNINGVGGLCLGDAHLPKVLCVDTIPEIEASFFNANGSHVNHDGTLAKGKTSSQDLLAFLEDKAKSESTITTDEMASYKTIREVLK